MANRAATPPSWDFAPIYNLLDNLKLHGDSSDDDIDTKRRPLSPLPRWPSPSRFEPHAIVPRDLGDFNYLYEYLGVATGQNNRSKHLSINSDSSLSSQSFVSSEATHSKTESPPSSLNGDAIQLDDFLDLEDIRRVRWTDEMDGKEFPKLGRSPKNSRVSWQSPPIKNSADFDSDSEVETFRRTHAHNLIPSWVTPQPKLWVPPIPKTFPLPYIIQPIDTLTFEEKWAKLSKKLKHKFGSASSKVSVF
jgi:hypothetical protein